MQLSSSFALGMEIAVDEIHQEKTLHRAVEDLDLTEVTRLLQLNADVNAKNATGATPLHEAAMRGNVEICKILLEHGVDCNQINNSRSTPLHIALNKEVVQILLAHKANLDAVDKNNLSPFYAAAKAGNTEVVTCLIEDNGINVRAADKDGNTPLHYVST